MRKHPEIDTYYKNGHKQFKRFNSSCPWEAGIWKETAAFFIIVVLSLAVIFDFLNCTHKLRIIKIIFKVYSECREKHTSL